MNALAQEVAARTERLAAASVEGLYQDPFWFARYGEARARRFGSEDAVFHVRYLVQALETRDAGVMERYARWLRGLLVPRGMSSRHIATHFQGLRAALVHEGLTSPPQAVEYMRAAEQALQWTEGPALALERALEGLVSQTVRELTARGVSLAGLEEEVRLQFSYLADSLGTGRSGLFVDHVRWYAGFWPRRGRGGDYRTVLRTLEASLAGDASLAELPRVTVAMGLTALDEEHP
ncbi:hypothetical protein [Archangium primigenium]|uniref:hypothetical protein n=1 Tax=[Archangium] primigenium TaxID=2792470 RepID=UPI001956B0E9|nr:hypothetical protein [Archangium primigenium]MBM7112229.1 hypothetical protein [Archangium primigenium]